MYEGLLAVGEEGAETRKFTYTSPVNKMILSTIKRDMRAKAGAEVADLDEHCRHFWVNGEDPDDA